MISFTQFITETPGLYAAFTLDAKSASELYIFVKKHNLPLPQTAASYHVTTVYTRKPIDHDVVDGTGVELTPLGYELFGKDDDKMLVLTVDAPILHSQFNAAINKGAETDFPTYRPHITLTQKIPANSVDITTLPLPDFPIYLGKEYTAPLREDVDSSE